MEAGFLAKITDTKLSGIKLARSTRKNGSAACAQSGLSGRRLRSSRYGVRDR